MDLIENWTLGVIKKRIARFPIDVQQSVSKNTLMVDLMIFLSNWCQIDNWQLSVIPKLLIFVFYSWKVNHKFQPHTFITFKSQLFSVLLAMVSLSEWCIHSDSGFYSDRHTKSQLRKEKLGKLVCVKKIHYLLKLTTYLGIWFDWWACIIIFLFFFRGKLYLLEL